MNAWLLAAASEATPSAEFLVDPSFWLNAGAIGIGFGLFLMGRLHSNSEMERVEKLHEAALNEMRTQHTASMTAQREQHGAAMTQQREQHAQAMDELRRQHEATIKFQKESHAAAMERMDDHVRLLILERDKANAERNEAVGVMRDFTLMASAILGNQRPPWGDSLPPSLGGD